MTRDALAFTLWPDDAEIDALTKLRRHMYSARRAFGNGADPLLGTKLNVAFNRAAVWCDVSAFESARKAGDFDSAVALYSGPLLAGSLDDIVIAERERLQSHFMRMADELLRRARKGGEDDRDSSWPRGCTTSIRGARTSLERSWSCAPRTATGPERYRSTIVLQSAWSTTWGSPRQSRPPPSPTGCAPRRRPSRPPSRRPRSSCRLWAARATRRLTRRCERRAAGSGRLAFVCGEAASGRAACYTSSGANLQSRLAGCDGTHVSGRGASRVRAAP